MRRVPLSRVHPGPCRPQGAFSSSALQRLTSSVVLGNIVRPIVLHRSDIGNCRVVTNRHHIHTSHLTNGAAVPTVIHRFSRATVVRITVLRGLRQRSLAPLRRTRNCRALVGGLGLARISITRQLNGDHPCVTGRLHLLGLPRSIGKVLRRKLVSVKRTHALLNLGSRSLVDRLTGQTTRRNVAIQRLRLLIRRLGGPNSITGGGGGGGGRAGPMCVGRDRRHLVSGFKASMRVSDGNRGNGVRVRCLSPTSLAQVLSVLRVSLSSWR